MGTQGGGGISNPQGGILDFFCVFGCLAKFVFFCVHLCVFVFPPPRQFLRFCKDFFFTQKILHFYSAPIFPQAKTVSHFLFLSYFFEVCEQNRINIHLKNRILVSKKAKRICFLDVLHFFCCFDHAFSFLEEEEECPKHATMHNNVFENISTTLSKKLQKPCSLEFYSKYQSVSTTGAFDVFGYNRQMFHMQVAQVFPLSSSPPRISLP